jgi:hypothetical protein
MLEELRKRWRGRLAQHGLENEQVKVSTKPLKPVEAIGKPVRNDYALMRGREVLIEAELNASVGHAFTDEPSESKGSLLEFYSFPIDSNGARARLVATINATYRYLGLVNGTRHCRDHGPELCAAKIPEYLAEKHSSDNRILIIGFQPAIVQQMTQQFKNLRVTDNDVDNVDKMIQDVKIEPGTKNREIIESSDIVLATGSTLVNGSIDDIMSWSCGKTIYFYGVTIAAAAYEFKLKRLCFEPL